ncbi:hypothetical protein ACLEEJ_00175 [Lonsdalea quercina]|uniref:hypothetical protein n=1 Tax=Lonsdalea quercina TaxID=71657 RepID=UPI003975697F
MKKIIMAIIVILSGCGDNASYLPIGINLGIGVSDFKKKVNTINEVDFPDTVPATLIKFDSPPKKFIGDQVSYQAQTRQGKVIGVMIWARNVGIAGYEEKIKESSDSFGASVANEKWVANDPLSKLSAMQCAIKRTCPGDKYQLFVSGGFSTLITLNKNDISIIYSKDDEMNKSMGR